jgi:DNA invertase Pin-like site-specific DNA recombinase
MNAAAIYARKSQEQYGVADEEKSVTRQVERGRDFAATNGWTVAAEHVFVDDGIGGAEFSERPGFVRLMNSLKPRPPFDVLIMSEEARLGREQIEVSYALKQIVTSGVRVFCYLTGTERTLDTPIDKAMLAMQSMADEMEREKARQRTSDAMMRKARAGHACGGRTFGFDNFCSACGRLIPAGTTRCCREGHTRKRRNDAEAAIVQRIFEECARGRGLTSITKMLNAEGVRTPRPQQGRPCGWVASSVREVLRRPLYKGEIVWNRTRKRDRWGAAASTGSTGERLAAHPGPRVADCVGDALERRSRADGGAP